KDMKQRYEKFIQENKREPKYIKINEEEYITTQKFKEILKKIPLAPDTNIENTDTTITAQEIKDAIKRYEEIKKTNNREPKIIYLRPSEYVPLQKFKEMKQRWDIFITTNNREPKNIKIKNTPDTNIENTDTTITAQEFKDAIKRYEEFKKTNNREPKIIYLRPSEYVPLQKFKEMKQRWDLFIATYQREPKTIKVKKDFNYFRVVTFIAEKQDTGYTCGPSSLAMLLRELSDGTLKIT